MSEPTKTHPHAMTEPTTTAGKAQNPSADTPLQTPVGVPSFETRDPGTAAFWDERFRKGFTPWDQAGVPDDFRAFVARNEPRPVLIPGCGSAHEALWLAQAGWPVRAIDFSADAVVAAREQLGTFAPLVEQADFFRYRPPFSVGWIYERAFFCALPPARRLDYAERMAALLAPGALLAGFFFIGATPKGPPFGVERSDLEALFASNFDLIEDEPANNSLPVFEGRERWLTWRRRESAGADGHGAHSETVSGSASG
jgi:Thiopurine S-methyltransferase (TPMT)